MKQPLSLRSRLLLSLMLMTVLTLIIASGLSALMDLRLFHDQMERDLEVLASVVGESCVSALVFESRESAEQRLATLSEEYQIRSAVLYDVRGRRFAHWQHAAEAAPSTVATLEIVKTLAFDGRPIGRLVLTARLSELSRQTRLYLWLAAAVARITLGLAFVGALHLLRRISWPIGNLEGTMREVSEHGDFSVRVPDLRAGREIDALANGFNQMLERIEERDAELRQANTTLHKLAGDLSMLEELEKARLSGELHDGPMQNLAFALLQIASIAEGDGCDDPEETTRQIKAGVQLMREAVAELRTLQFALSPPILRERGLPDALEWLAGDTRERWGIAMSCTIDPGLPDLGERESAILYRCARELVNNMVKHADAGAISLSREDTAIVLAVEDDGRGVPAGDAARWAVQPGTGYGLFSIRERVGLLGGSFEVEAPAKGARFIVRLASTQVKPDAP